MCDESFDAVDVRWMREAIALSASVLYTTTPNPRVGCLIVRDGQVLASGATQPAGGPHAEIMALRQAQALGADVSGATFYVTLEPCSHHGRTPPCVDALLQARPARVVIAMRDPNPLVAGNGIARLRQAGIETVVGVCADDALQCNPGFVSRMTRGTPWVWLKAAISLDGRVALRNGKSQWITGSQARADGHHWRARSCAVLTGIGTVKADNPQLTPRMVQTPRTPLRIVVDTWLRLDPQARILDGCTPWPVSLDDAVADQGGAAALGQEGGRVLVFTASDNAEKAALLARSGARVVRLPASAGGIDLRAMMQWLGGHGINELHVEAGSRLNGALLRAGLVDELLTYVAPVLLGDAIPMADLPVLNDLAQAQRYAFVESTALGPDLRIRARHQASWQALLDSVAPSAEAKE